MKNKKQHVKNNQNNKHKNVLFIIGTQGIAKSRSLAIVRGLLTSVSRPFYVVRFSQRHQNGSTSRARALSRFGAFFNLQYGASSTSRARALSLLRTGFTRVVHRTGSTSRARALSQPGVQTDGQGHRASSTSRARALSLLGVFAHAGRQISSTSRARALSLFGALIVMITVPMALNVGQANAATSNQLNFQGRLLTSTGGLVPDGTYNMEFNLYYQSAGGVSQWTEDRLNTNTQGVTIRNGYFSVYLGEYDTLPALDWSEDLYLGMTVRGTGSCVWGSCTPADTEMTPRFKLTSVPYAFRAANVASSNTNTASTNSDGVSITTGDALGVTSNSGNISIDVGTATGTAGSLLFGTSNASMLTIGNASATTTLQGSVSLTGSGTALTVNNNTTLGSDGTDTLTVNAAATFNGNLTVSAGDLFTNAGATLFTAITINDDADGGVLGSTAAATVDIATSLNVNQTTASQTFTLASPTNTAAGRILYVNNVGSAEFTLEGNPIAAGESASYIWNGTTWVQTISFTSTGVDTLGAIGSTPNANGASISGTTLTLQPADGSFGGVVTITSQTFAGVKTFNDGIIIAAGETMRIIGGNTLSRPAGTLGELYFDTDTNTLLTYNGTKWIADRGDYVIVAANDSTQAEKDSADYVADGTSDQVEINNALTAASGGKVHLLKGTFVVSDSISIPNNTTLEGTGKGTVIELADLDADESIIVNADTTTGTGVIIRNMKLDGRADLNTAGNQRGIDFVGMGGGSGDGAREGGLIEGLYIERVQTRGISLDNSDNNIISNNFINDNDYTGTSGIRISASTNNTITGNYIGGNLTGIALLTGSNDNTISGNTMEGNFYNLVLNASNHNLVGSNVLSNSGDRSVFISNGSTYNVVNGNRFSNTGGPDYYQAIIITSSDYNSITSNIITDTACSINCDAIIISDSASDKNYFEANRISGPAATASGISDSGTGTIYAGQQVNSSTGADSDVSDFRFRGSANSTTAFAVQDASGTSVLNVDTSTAGVAVAGTLTVTGLTTLNGGLTIEAGDTFTFNGDGFTDFTGGGLVNTGGVLTVDATSATGFFQNGGNSFGGTATLGTNDNNSLVLRTNSTAALTINNVQAATFAGTLAVEGASITVGEASTTTGGITLLNATNPFGVTVSAANQTVGSATISIPDTAGVADTFCLLTLANCGGGDLSSALTDNITDALDIQEGTNNYININTTDTSEAITFGNSTTNPDFYFQGSGNFIVYAPATFEGGLTVQAGDTFTFNGDGFTDFTGGGLYNNSGVLSVDNTYLDDSFFQNGGNTFAAGAVLGTNDNNSLVLRTNSTTALTIDTTQNITTAGRLTVNPGIITDSGAAQTINVSLGNDSDNDVVAGLQINATTQNTGDVDVIAGLFVNNLSGTAGTTGSAALLIGTGWANDIGLTSTNARMTIQDILRITDGTTGGGNDLLTIDVNGTVGDVGITGGLQVDGNTGLNNATAPNLLSINTLTTADANAQVAISTGGTGNVGLLIQGVAGQTADLFRIEASNGTNTLTVEDDGSIHLQNVVDSNRAFQIQDDSGNTLFRVDTTNNRVNIGSNSSGVNEETTLNLYSSDNSNDPGASTGTTSDYEGDIYYNGSLGKFRCNEEGVWRDCVRDVDNFQSERVQYAGADGTTASATFSKTPQEGNLLVAISLHRTEGTAPTISGSGWTLVRNDCYGVVSGGCGTANTGYRRGMAVWYKIAGGSEPTNVQTSWTPSSDNRLLIQEFSANGGYFVFDNSAGANSGASTTSTQTTGTSAATSAENTLSISILGTRDAESVDNWTNGFSDSVSFTDTRSISSAFKNVLGTGTQESTATFNAGNKYALGAIINFSVYPSQLIVQDGNTFGQALTIGTNDNYDFNIETNGTTRLTVDATGNTSLTGGLTVSGVSTFNGNVVIGNANTDTLLINAGSSGTGIQFGDSSFQNCVLTTDGSGVLTCAASGALITLQGAYTGGNTITATDAEGDIALTVSEATNFTVNIAGTGNFRVQDGGTNVLSIADGGAATFQNTTDSANAFRVLSSAGGAYAGTSVLGVDTTNFAVDLASTRYKTVSNASCGSNCTITQANIDTNAAIIVEATADGLEISLPDPTDTTAGRLVYITAANGSEDFTLIANGGGVNNEIAMRQNTTATMIWNGSDWTAAGASSSTTLQAAYDNTLTSAGGAEIVLNNTSTSNGLTVRNNDTSPIIGAIFEAQTSVGSNLFSVNNNATEYATNGGAEQPAGSSTVFPASTWSAAPDGGTVSRYVTTGDYVATGQASVSVVTGATVGHGVENQMASALTPNLRYSVSFAVRGTSSFSTLDVHYSPDGTTTGLVACATAQTVTQGAWTRITCFFDAPASGITSSNAIFIRQSDATARTFYIENLSVTVKADVNHAADGSVDDAGAFTTNWTAAPAGGTASRDTGVIYDTSGSASVVTGATIGHGIRNNMAITPTTNTQYLVTFYARSSNTFSDIRVRYTRDGGTNYVSCVDYNTQDVSTASWTRITCLFTTDGSAPTDADLVIDQPTATARTFYVDALSITLNTNTASNVKIGGGSLGGPTTLLTLDRSAGPPVAANNDAYLGSMYYDTLTGRIQCYESGGWGTCGAPPDNIVNLNPEYAGSVLNGSGVGTMQADVCANESGVLQVNTSLCASGEARNFYQWTSPQATEQTYSIYVTYQLPSTFDGFSSDDTVQLTGRVDSTTNAAVTYEMFRSQGGTITQCGSGETNVASVADTWQTVGINGNEATGCSFTSASANAFVLFKINLKAESNANAYVSTLTFTTTGR